MQEIPLKKAHRFASAEPVSSVIVGPEANPAALGCRWRHQFTDSLEYQPKLGVVLLLQFFQFPREITMRGQYSAQPDKRPHDLDIDENRLPASQNTGEHGHSLLRERKRCVATSSPT